MKAKRLTIHHPDGERTATKAHLHERSDCVAVRLAGDRLDYENVEGCSITVSGPTVDDAPLGRIKREWTYHGEITDVDAVAGFGGVTVSLRCRPASIDQTVMP
jgi:hypothetical protein